MQNINVNQKYLWIVDPIDGTFNFVKSVPFFGTLIGLLNNEIPTYGSLRLPMIENRLLTGDNKNAFINDVLDRQTTITIDDDRYTLVSNISERKNRLTANNFIVGSSFNFLKNNQEI